MRAGKPSHDLMTIGLAVARQALRKFRAQSSTFRLLREDRQVEPLDYELVDAIDLSYKIFDLLRRSLKPFWDALWLQQRSIDFSL